MLSFGQRVSFAFRCFFSLLFKGRVADDILAALTGAAQAATVVQPATSARAPALPPSPPPDDPGERAVQLLAILQRDGRLVDFLREDLAGYSDAQVGAAVRDVHRNCGQALEKYVRIEPILPDEEGGLIAVGAPVDPSTITLVGNVGQQASYRGTVRHRGWRVGRLDLPPLPSPDARLIVAPAEVEIG